MEKSESQIRQEIFLEFLLYSFSNIILEQKRFAVFCLARIGCKIIDTQMKSIDKKSTEIIFTDKIIL